MSAIAPTYCSIAELQKAIQDGKTTVRAVTEAYLNSIDSQNDDLNAVICTNDGALDQADQLDSLPLEARGSLFGLPILIKDQIETAGIATTFGSKACKGYVPVYDATVVRKLKDAGAVILGKTTMPDWATSWFSTSSLSGTTKHPIDHSRDPGGSSSGNGTAVAVGMALAAIGGDTGGSILLPASFCGLVGMRVTPGRISRNGMSALLMPQDTPGPMCKTVEDVAKILDVLVGYDEADPYTSINALAGHSTFQPSFREAANTGSLKGKRLGVLRQAFGTHKGILGSLDATLNDLKQAGADLIDVEIAEFDHFKDVTLLSMLQSKSNINAFLASREELEHLKIQELVAAGTYHKCLDELVALVKGADDFCQSPHFGKVLMDLDRFRRTVACVFAQNELDAIVYPSAQLLAPKTQEVIDMRWDSSFPANSAICGQLLCTAISVPIRRALDDEFPDDPELPVGLEILGPPLSEERVLGIASAIEALGQK